LMVKNLRRLMVSVRHNASSHNTQMNTILMLLYGMIT
jgi:hypothetical protein